VIILRKTIVVVSALIAIILTVSFIGIITTSSLAEENHDLLETLNGMKEAQPTLVFHVSEKGDDYVYARLPNATYTYDQILALNSTSKIALLPEYKGNINWTEELSWIAANFGGPKGIPIMLDVFGGGSQDVPTPMLSTSQISEAMNEANIKYLRFAEVISWHLEHKQPFPTDYVSGILEFCKANNLQLFWTEWKNDYPDKNVETFSAIQNYIKGYEETAIVSFSTNSQELEPADAYLKLDQNFTQWGASIQPWYWNTTHSQDLMACPPSLILEHTLTAKALGAKIIQFEPYWYFFNYAGSPNDNLKLIINHLKDR
jgi:hypothetical protein